MVSCSRCDKKLGLRKIDPKFDWQMEGKICPECNNYISENTSYYEAEYKETEPDFPKQKGVLAIQNFDGNRKILFIEKDKIQFEIPLPSVQKFESVEYTEKSTKKKVTTLGLRDKSTSKHLQITFVGDNGVYSPIFQIKDFESVSRSLNLHIQRYYEESENITPPQSVVDAIKNARKMQFKDLGMSEKLTDNNNEIRKIKKYLDKDERILYLTKQGKEKESGSAENENMIFATDKRVVLKNSTALGKKDLVMDMPYDKISSIKLLEGALSSTIVFNGTKFAELDTISQASLQRAWGIEEESTIQSLSRDDAKDLTRILREQIKKNGIKNLEFTHITN